MAILQLSQSYLEAVAAGADHLLATQTHIGNNSSISAKQCCAVTMPTTVQLRRLLCLTMAGTDERYVDHMGMAVGSGVGELTTASVRHGMAPVEQGGCHQLSSTAATAMNTG
jgi:hypothetical protein